MLEPADASRDSVAMLVMSFPAGCAVPLFLAEVNAVLLCAGRSRPLDKHSIRNESRLSKMVTWRSWDHLCARKTVNRCRSTAFSASSFIIDLIDAAKTVRTKHKSRIISST
jgi:hypothetical protein